MKLFRYGDWGKERPGAFVNGELTDVFAFGEDYTEQFFETNGLQRLRAFINANPRLLKPVPQGVRLGAPVCRPSKLICIGLNYVDHAIETNLPIPEEPVVFFKSTTAICGPNDDVMLPRGSTKTDWEVELAVAIGKRARYIDESDALDHVAGYLLHNDYSERAFQLEHGGQWVKGKSCDTFAPLGPYLVTPDELGDVHNLAMWLSVNGKTIQESNTSQLIFRIPRIISYLSRFMTLLPGDIISTGTPSGVGMGLNPPTFLKPGDRVELGIDGLGSSGQNIVPFSTNYIL
ncbi:fumarylacetoacetate hydrolase family protein [Parapedobacter lycopersici]|uniref:fumarylacetoacetate hydrolase family protein n=1 Tax=Parapedobacter lycopersici TaxID=1864939 RepID=UPI00333F802D